MVKIIASWLRLEKKKQPLSLWFKETHLTVRRKWNANSGLYVQVRLFGDSSIRPKYFLYCECSMELSLFLVLKDKVKT